MTHARSRTHEGSPAAPRPGWARRLLAAAAIVGVSLGAGCAGKRPLEADNLELIEQARVHIAHRNFLKAIERLGDVGLVDPIAPELDPELKLLLADAYFYQSGTVNVIEAQSRYEQFLAFYPLHERAPYARYRIGACLMRQSEDAWNDQDFTLRARHHLERLLEDLDPSDRWYLPAKAMLQQANRKLAEHEFLVGEFYFEREKWKGAALRFRTVTDHYPTSPRREEAMSKLGQALFHLGEIEQARAVLRRQIDEFPDGAWAAASSELLERLAASPQAATAEADGST